MSIKQYIINVKEKLANSPVIEFFSITKEQDAINSGYLRARILFSNGEFLEIAEYFVLDDLELKTERYSYQWMNNDKTELVKRWDNVPHFPDLDNFPHHVHIGRDNIVEPSQSQNILQILVFIEQKII